MAAKCFSKWTERCGCGCSQTCFEANLPVLTVEAAVHQPPEDISAVGQSERVQELRHGQSGQLTELWPQHGPQAGHKQQSATWTWDVLFTETHLTLICHDMILTVCHGALWCVYCYNGTWEWASSPVCRPGTVGDLSWRDTGILRANTAFSDSWACWRGCLAPQTYSSPTRNIAADSWDTWTPHKPEWTEWDVYLQNGVQKLERNRKL